MKKINSYIFAALAVAGLAGCQAEVLVENVPAEVGTHTVSFIAGQEDTKTSMEIASGVVNFDWTAADADNFTIYENGIEATDNTGVLVGDVMSITAEFANTDATTFRYDAYLNGGVPAEQSCTAVTYDSSADVLVAKTVNATVAETDFTFQFKRVVAISQMTIKGMEDGETIESVVISSDKNITGDFALDPANDFAETWSNEGKTITLTPSSTITVASGKAVVNFVTLPVEGAQLWVIVKTTDGKYYTKKFAQPISFAEGRVKTFGVTVSEDSVYTLVTSKNDITDGNYVVAANVGGQYMAMSTEFGSKVSASEAVVINGFVFGPDVDAVTITKNGDSYYVYNGSNYLKYVSSTNLGSASSAYAWNIAEGVKGTFRFVASGDSGRALVYRAGTTNKFGAYSTSNVTAGGTEYYDVELFKSASAGSNVNVASVSLSETSINVELNGTVELTATVLPADATNPAVNWSSSAEGVATVDNAGKVTGISVGEAVITATTVDGGKTASCTVTVFEPVVTPLSIAEFNALMDDESWYQLTGEITEINSYGNPTIKDATGSVYVFSPKGNKAGTVTFKSLGLKVGDMLTIIGKHAIYDDEPELVDGYYVSHVPAASVSASPSTLVFTADGGSKDITVSVTDFTSTVTVTAESDNAQFTASVNGMTVSVEAAENTGSTVIEGTITITATDGIQTKTVEVTVSQSKPLPAAAAGTVLWAEDFSTTTVYGGGAVTKSYTDGGSTTKTYSENSAGGTAPELLISKSNGAMTVTDIPTGAATSMTLTYKTNNDYCTISSTTEGVTVNKVAYADKVVTALVSVPAGVKSFDLIFKNTKSNNCRVDEFRLIAGWTKLSAGLSGINTEITLGDTKNVESLFSSNSDATISYSIKDAPTGASLDGTTFSATAEGEYVIVASQEATDIYDSATAEATITVSESQGTGGGSTTSWVLVTDASSLAAGDVIKLGCAAKGKAAGAMGDLSYFTSKDAEISNGELTCDEAIEITLGGSAGAWTLTTSEGQITTSAAKAIKIADGTQKTWTISVTSAGVAKITGGSYGYIQFNASNPRFVNYTSAQTGIEIYKKTVN